MRLVTIPGFSLQPASWAGVTSQLEGIDAQLWDVPSEGDFLSVVGSLAHEIGEAAYAGYSMGGRIALAIAMEHPGLVDRLVLVSSSPGIESNEERVARVRADDELADWIEQVGVDRFLDRWLSEPIFAGVDHDAARQYRLEDVSVIISQLRRLGQGAQPSFWDRLPQLEMPVLFLAGGDDVKYAAMAEKAAAAIGANASVELIPDAGHSLLVERPAAVAGAIAAFLGRPSS